MDVYLLLLPRARAVLYCERALTDAVPASATGLRARLSRKVEGWLADGERGGHDEPHDPRWLGRQRQRFMRWIVQAIAEQRVLWLLRRQSNARLFHPDDLASGAALETALGILRADRRRHFWWLGVDGVLALVSVPIALVPGPNVVGYYFLFRTIGHCFSIVGAGRGLTRVAWTAMPSAELTAVRDVLGAETDRTACHGRIAVIGLALGLSRLANFLDVAERD